MYYPTTIKDTIQWFPLLIIMEHTANILNPKQGLINSLLNIFAIFEFRLIDDRDILEDIYVSCINCKKETGLYLRTSNFE